jgi:hypothetical protein
MKTEYDNMKQTDDFLKFGKPLPYQEPDGFFDGLSQRTLEIAKQRTRNHNKLKIVWKSMAVAASIAALVFLGFLIQEKQPEPVVAEIHTQTIETPVVQEQTESPIQEPTIVSEQKYPEKEISTALAEENVNDILAELTDEELLQMAAMFEADLFTNETDLDNLE